MDKREAEAVAEEHLEPMRRVAHRELAKRLIDDGPVTGEARGGSGRTYQYEINGFWDTGEVGGDLRVMIAVDDGGWRSFKPLTRSFILRPDGSFAGE